MARIRTIKPSFFTSLTVAGLTPEQRLTFIGLWTHVDDEGRCVDDARLIKAALWPLDDRTAADIERDLRALTEASVIVRYILNERSYLAVRSWAEHQRISHPSGSSLPSPEEGEIRPLPPTPTCGNVDSVSPHGSLTEGSTQERKGREGKGTSLRDTSEPSAPTRIDVEQACTLLADLIEQNGTRRPTITRAWRDSARRMIDLDKVPLADVLGAIRWCQADDFWAPNILSMPKLRKQYPQLRLKAQAATARAQPRAAAGSHQAYTDRGIF